MATPKIYEAEQVALFPVMDEDLLNTEDVKVCLKILFVFILKTHCKILEAAIKKLFFAWATVWQLLIIPKPSVFWQVTESK